jgi:ketosteroid isomerase-like protein
VRPHQTPAEAITALVNARNDGDIDTALGCYEPDAVVVAGPGTILTGARVALHYSHWTLAGTAPEGTPLDLAGRSTDVFRRQPDGGWLLGS